MTRDEHDAHWFSLKQEICKELGIGEGQHNHDDEMRAVRKTLTAFLAKHYAAQWSAHYERLGIEIVTPREVLEARATELHHWTPETVTNMSSEALVKSLANDFSHLDVPHEAREVIHIRTSDLPEGPVIADCFGVGPAR